jgi:hypothetical protein
MTEAEWLTCTDPRPMLEFLPGKASDRKLRLFAVACRRSVWDLLFDTAFHQLIVLAEQHADQPEGNNPFRLAEHIITRPEGWTGGRFHIDECNAEEAVLHVAGVPPGAVLGFTCDGRIILADARFSRSWELLQPVRMARYTSELVASALARQEEDGRVDMAQSRQEHSRFLRCLFGQVPFRLSLHLPPAILAWNGGTVRKIAQPIYDECAFDRMPILADALEGAGCDNADILNHCREPGYHVRGCWIVDLLLGKN